MFLKDLSLLNFKNHEESNLFFSEKINCFHGNNGSGKTNILDAIHYLSFTKSYFLNQDTLNIKHDESFFSIRGKFFKNEKNEIVHCSIKNPGKKIFKINNRQYNRFSDHIGLFPLVLISPTDVNLIIDGSDVRRKYIDSVISQFNPQYLEHLIKYNRIIKQRNVKLKQLSIDSYFDETLDLYDEQLAPIVSLIFNSRKSLLEKLLPIVNLYYDKISDNSEKINIKYNSQMHKDNYLSLSKTNRKKDLLIKHSSIGIHKDDFIYELNGHSIKKIGSQGQQKTFLMALKLAQFDFIKKTLGFKPLLLLDDVFDKLDEIRVQELMRLVDDSKFGQIFITDTNIERSVNIFKNINAKYKLFYVDNGTVKETE